VGTLARRVGPLFPRDGTRDRGRDDPDSRGLIVEAEAGAVPVFDGGAAYASMALPLAGGRRATVAMEGGANRASLAYRDEVFRDRPVVLEGRIIYETTSSRPGPS